MSPPSPDSPDGYIAISARSGSYGSLMDAANTEQPEPANSKQAKTVDSPSVEEVSEFAKDSVPPLRPVGSGKSILKQTSSGSGDLDSMGSGKIKRAVSWHDFEGKHLHTVREFTRR